MPTGYTADVIDGKITTFHEFAKECARAFGVLIHMRDDPRDAPIPEVIEPHSYHRDAKVRTLDRLNDLLRLTPEQADAKAQEAYDKAVERWNEDKARKDAEEAALNAMKVKVEGWVPPTPEHQSMKSFMLQQIEVSMPYEFNRPYPVRMSGEKWLAREQEDIDRDLVYHERQWTEDKVRAESKTAFLRAFLDSLPDENDEYPTDKDTSDDPAFADH